MIFAHVLSSAQGLFGLKIKSSCLLAFLRIVQPQEEYRIESHCLFFEEIPSHKGEMLGSSVTTGWYCLTTRQAIKEESAEPVLWP